jgi:hypothetical protein
MRLGKRDRQVTWDSGPNRVYFGSWVASNAGPCCRGVLRDRSAYARNLILRRRNASRRRLLPDILRTRISAASISLASHCYSAFFGLIRCSM